MLAPLHFDMEDVIRHTHGIHPQRLRGRRGQDVACPDVEFGAMTGADYLRALEISFGQRTLLMRAGIVEGVEHAIDIGDSDSRPADIDSGKGPRAYRAGFRTSRGFKRHRALLVVLSPAIGSPGQQAANAP